MTPVFGRVCAAHRLPTALVLDLDSSGSEAPMFMKLTDALQRLMQQVEDAVPQPEHKSQMGARSVVQAMRASHGTAGWACKAVSDEADLVRRTSARRGRHRELVGAVQAKSRNLCVKGLIPGQHTTQLRHSSLQTLEATMP